MNTAFTPYLERIESVIKEAIPSVPTDSWMKDSFGFYDPPVNAAHTKPLTEPTSSLVNLGGKRWRPLLLVLTAEAELISQGKRIEENSEIVSKAFSLTPLVEFVHTASLIHDDIEDCSTSRRGKPAAYITYGTDTAINAGSWLYFEAPVVIDSLDCSKEMKANLYSLYSMELRRLHLGQAMDIAWHRDPSVIPSEGDYITMVKSKTGTLSSFACKTGALIAGAADKKVTQYGAIASQIGAGFQIIDDVINLTTGNPGKKRGDDIVEGKKSLIVLKFMAHCGKDSAEARELEECFVNARKDGIDSPYVEKAIGLLEESGFIKEAKEEGIRYIEQSIRGFEDLSGRDNSSVRKIGELFISMIPKGI